MLFLALGALAGCASASGDRAVLPRADLANQNTGGPRSEHPLEVEDNDEATPLL